MSTLNRALVGCVAVCVLSVAGCSDTYVKTVTLPGGHVSVETTTVAHPWWGQLGEPDFMNVVYRKVELDGVKQSEERCHRHPTDRVLTLACEAL